MRWNGKHASESVKCVKYREKRIHIGYFKLGTTSRLKYFEYESKNILLIKKRLITVNTRKTSNDTILETCTHFQKKEYVLFWNVYVVLREI